MTLTATNFGGNTINGASGNLNPGSLVSAAGDRVIVIYAWFDGGGAAAQGAAVTSTPAKTFVKDTEVFSTQKGIAVFSWVSDGTTLTQIALTPTAVGSVGSIGGGTVLVHSTVGTVTYDSTTKGSGTDAVTPLTWSGGAISGTQIGLLCVAIDNGALGTFTTSSGYTDLNNYGDGSLSYTNLESYKVNETGTPALSVAYTAAISAALELFVSFKEPASGYTGAGTRKLESGAQRSLESGAARVLEAGPGGTDQIGRAS
jgi:hypothetical protein